MRAIWEGQLSKFICERLFIETPKMTWKPLAFTFLLIPLAQSNLHERPPHCTFLEKNSAINFFSELLPDKLRTRITDWEPQLRASEHYWRTCAVCGWLTTPSSTTTAPLNTTLPSCSTPELVCEECASCDSPILTPVTPLAVSSKEERTTTKPRSARLTEADDEGPDRRWFAAFYTTLVHCVTYGLFWGLVYYKVFVQWPLAILNSFWSNFQEVFPTWEIWPQFCGYVFRHWLKIIFCRHPDSRHTWEKVKVNPSLMKPVCQCCKSMTFHCANKLGGPQLPRDAAKTPLVALVDSQFGILESLRKRATDDSLLYTSLAEAGKNLQTLLLELQRMTESLSAQNRIQAQQNAGTIPRARRTSNKSNYQTVHASLSQLPSPDSAYGGATPSLIGADLLGDEASLVRFQSLEANQESSTLQIDKLTQRVFEIATQLQIRCDDEQRRNQKAAAALSRQQENLDQIITANNRQSKWGLEQFRRQQGLLRQAVKKEEEIFMGEAVSGCCTGGRLPNSPYEQLLDDLAIQIESPGILSGVAHLPVPEVPPPPPPLSNLNNLLKKVNPRTPKPQTKAQGDEGNKELF